MKAYFTDTEAQAIRAEYESGATVVALSLKHHCCPETIKNTIKRAGGVLTGNLQQHDREEMVRLYQSGLTAIQVAHKLGCSDGLVYTALKQYGIAARHPRKSRSRYDKVKQMMINDWNTGRATRDMAKIYKATSQQIASLMCAWRDNGEEIEWRRK